MIVFLEALWVDPICRRNYSLFGDMVSFDTTFSTNRYNMVFGPFTGVDHHKRCIIFAAAFVAKEDTCTSRKWLICVAHLSALASHFGVTQLVATQMIMSFGSHFWATQITVICFAVLQKSDENDYFS